MHICIYIYAHLWFGSIYLSLCIVHTWSHTHTSVRWPQQYRAQLLCEASDRHTAGYPHGLDLSFGQSNSEVKALHEGTIETGGDDKPGSDWARNPRKSHRFSLLQTLMGCWLRTQRLYSVINCHYVKLCLGRHISSTYSTLDGKALLLGLSRVVPAEPFSNGRGEEAGGRDGRAEPPHDAWMPQNLALGLKDLKDRIAPKFPAFASWC